VLEGTQHGEFLGIAPTGKTVRALGMTSYRFTDGRNAEILVLADFVTVLRQLVCCPCYRQRRPNSSPLLT
jgi:predicted ester cyclase